MSVGQENRVLYYFYFINLLVAVTYCVLSLITFDKVKYILRDAENNALKLTLLASTILGFIVVALFQIISGFVLVWRIFASTGILGYGIVLGMSTHTSIIALLSGLVVQANYPSVKSWNKSGVMSNTLKNIYVATYGLSYATAVCHLILWFLLVSFVRTMTRTQGILSGDRSDGGSKGSNPNADAAPSSKGVSPVQPTVGMTLQRPSTGGPGTYDNATYGRPMASSGDEGARGGAYGMHGTSSNGANAAFPTMAPASSAYPAGAAFRDIEANEFSKPSGDGAGAYGSMR